MRYITNLIYAFGCTKKKMSTMLCIILLFSLCIIFISARNIELPRFSNYRMEESERIRIGKKKKRKKQPVLDFNTPNV